MQHIFKFVIGILFVPSLLLAQDDQALLLSVLSQHELAPSKPFSVPAINYAMDEQRKKGRQECYALHSVLSAYVTGKLEGDYDIKLIMDYILSLGLGIEYTPGYPLQVTSILAEDDILILPLPHKDEPIQVEDDPITEILKELNAMEEMFQTSNTEDENDWMFRIAKLNILNQHGVLTKLNYDF